jgi:hypothetical protein
VEPSSFSIEFHEHLPLERRQYCLDRLVDAGASVESKGERTFRIVVLKRGELAKVGWTLFHTHFSHLCRVIATSGAAEIRADAYPKPSKA